MTATASEKVSEPAARRWSIRAFFQRLYAGAEHDEPHVLLGDIDGASEGRAAAIQAALSHVLSRPDSIRQRAQNAATISGAFAAALIIAGVGQLTRGDEPYRWWTIGLMAVALVLWGLSAGLYVYAVAFIDKDRDDSKAGDVQGLVDKDPKAGDFQGLIVCYENYADKVRAGTRVAARVSGFALIFTVLAVGFEVGEQLISKPRSTTLILTPEGITVVDRLCRSPADRTRTDHVIAMVHREDLAERLVEINEVQLATLSSGEWQRAACGSSVSLHIPRAAIRASSLEGS